MAQKCEACGSASTTTGAWSHTCLECGHETEVHTEDAETIEAAPEPAPKKKAAKKG